MVVHYQKVQERLNRKKKRVTLDDRVSVIPANMGIQDEREESDASKSDKKSEGEEDELDDEVDDVEEAGRLQKW